MVVLTLAAGIGANSAVFSAIDAVLLEPLPFPNSDRLVRVRQVMDTETQIAPARLEDWRRLSTSFEVLTGYYVEDASDTTGTLPERIRRAVVAPQFLEAWGVEAILGQGSVDAQARTGGPSAVVISDRYWRRRFGGDPEVLARTVRIDGQRYAIVGVMPAVLPISRPRPSTSGGPTRSMRKARIRTGSSSGTPASAACGPASRWSRRAPTGRVVQARLGKAHPGIRRGDRRAHRALQGDGHRRQCRVRCGCCSAPCPCCCSSPARTSPRCCCRGPASARRRSRCASRSALRERVVFWQLLTETALLAFAGAAARTAGGDGRLQRDRRAGAGSSPPRGDRHRRPDARLHDGVGGGRGAALRRPAGVACQCRGHRPGARRANPGLGPARRAVAAGRRAGRALGDAARRRGVAVAQRRALWRASIRVSILRTCWRFRVSGNWTEAEDRARLVQRIEGTIDQLRALPGVESAATSWSLPGVPRQYQIEFQLSRRTGRVRAASRGRVAHRLAWIFRYAADPAGRGRACAAPAHAASRPPR